MKQKFFFSLLGVPIEALTEREARARMARLALHGRAARVFTPNPEILLAAARDAKLRQILCDADLLLPDGIGVRIGARLVGARLPERITGIDSAEWLLSFAERHSLRLFLLGGKAGVAEEAARRLVEQFPSLTICGTHHGYFDRTPASPENTRLIERIRAAEPELLFVCFGAPMQEKWSVENAESLPSVRLLMGLGGSLDVWSGRVKRAPRAVRRMGLEWLWRVLREPKRIRRLPALPRFLFRVWKEG